MNRRALKAFALAAALGLAAYGLARHWKRAADLKAGGVRRYGAATFEAYNQSGY